MDNAPDKSRRDVLLDMLRQEFPAYHPLVSIARIAHHGDADLKLQFECHRTIAKYIEPELKSLEVRGEINNRHRVSVSLFEPQSETFSPVEPMRVIEGESKQVDKVSLPKELPGGVTVDLDPAVTDRIVANAW